jgi:hypothetical protein
MSDRDGAAIDPRYDPAFQRGFSGEVQTGAHGQSTLRRTAAVNPAPARPAPQRVDDYRSPSPQPPLAVSRAVADAGFFAPAPDAAAASAAPGTAAPQQFAAPATASTPRELARNPFVIALAALAAVLILSGVVWAYEGFATIVKNGGTRNEVEFWAAQTMSFGAPLAIVVGLAVSAVLLVLFGRSWQRAGALEH